MSTLADRIRAGLAHAKISKAELARRCGVKQPSINGWLSGKAKFLRGENLLKAAAALGVSEQWLATGRGKMVDGAEPSPTAAEPDGVSEIRIALALAAQALAGSIPAAGFALVDALEARKDLLGSEFVETLIDTVRAELSSPPSSRFRPLAKQAGGVHKHP
jgi:transcriptional regulator with XRE-family HTH domain